MLDRIAIGLSGLCVIHCAATLILLATVASLGATLADPLIHDIGLAVAIVLAALALGFGYARHRKRLPLVIGTTGLILMALSLLAPHGVREFALSISGLALVIFAHYSNMRS